MTTPHQYDYIITGAGCAGLSLAVHMIRSGRFGDKSILLVDKEQKNRNDRTWCFWETKPGLFEDIVYKKWDIAWFHGEEYSKQMDIRPYQYKLIRGIDFYNYATGLIREQKNFTMLTGQVENMASTASETSITVDGQKFFAQYIFNSILFQKPALKRNEYWLLQHFKGWIIETDKPSFNSSEATLMDFRTSQQYGTAFVYCMPFSANRTLVEYTLFTHELLKEEQYEEQLKDYVERWLGIQAYRVAEEEFGAIPMTTHRFPSRRNNIIYIGTAGGQTKASSGYTFSFIQKHSAAIVDRLVNEKSPVVAMSKSRFRFYDNTLLHILHHNTLPGRRIFTDLFKKNKPQQVLRFLDNESSILNELKIISSLPTWPFLRAALRQL
ncbi:MAG: hypothetical protein JNK14_10845 [Chitinophagaceae bacterium]|nr:hypothetical protein [Chitinophagaceae bacterium]